MEDHYQLKDAASTAKAIFAYKSEAPDELAFEANEIITLDTSKSVDSGWSYGRIGDRAGMFPSNYVEVLVAAAPKTARAAPPVPPKPKPSAM